MLPGERSNLLHPLPVPTTLARVEILWDLATPKLVQRLFPWNGTEPDHLGIIGGTNAMSNKSKVTLKVPGRAVPGHGGCGSAVRVIGIRQVQVNVISQAKGPLTEIRQGR